jgi:hypothetical protein
MKKNKILGLLVTVVLFITYSGCSLDIDDGVTRVSGEGPLVTQVIPADTFNIFFHLALGNVIIITGDSLEVSLRAQQNIIDLMDFQFDDDKFGWGFKEKVNIIQSDTILLTIKIPNPIEAISLVGNGSLDVIGNKQESLYIDIVGVGDINSYGLELDYCEINISGVAVCRIRVNKELSGLVSGVGTIYHRGDPTVTLRIFGEGEIIDDD